MKVPNTCIIDVPPRFCSAGTCKQCWHYQPNLTRTNFGATLDWWNEDKPLGTVTDNTNPKEV